jgi:histidyl-tRNA synthetase
VLEYLDELKVEYTIDHTLVRGLDYYSRTVFEFSVAGSHVGVLPAGGRYDYLFEMLGARPTPAVGGAAGVERLISVMQSQQVKLPTRSPPKVFVIYVGDLAKQRTLSLLEMLRASGVGVAEAFGKESLKAQLKAADKSCTPLALILGQREIYEESVLIRDLATGAQEIVRLDKVVEEVKKRLKNN